MQDNGTGFSPPRLVIFDCDGTLVDSQHHIVSAVHAAFGAHGLSLPPAEAVRRTIGMPLSAAIRHLMPPQAGMIDLVIETYKQTAVAQRQSPEHEEPLYPGLVDALDRLEAMGHLLGVATGKAMRGLTYTLTSHGLTGRFVTLQTSDTVTTGKPAPDMVLQAMAETGAVPASTIMVGDTTYDMEMARNAGVAAIGVSWGYHDETMLLNAGADRIINSFKDLPDAVSELIGGAVCAS